MGSRDNVRERKLRVDTATTQPSAPLGAAILSDASWTEIARSLKLTKRELEMTHGVFDNLTEGAIAADVGISEHTTHRHLNRLFKNGILLRRTGMSPSDTWEIMDLSSEAFSPISKSAVIQMLSNP